MLGSDSSKQNKLSCRAVNCVGSSQFTDHLGQACHSKGIQDKKSVA